MMITVVILVVSIFGNVATIFFYKKQLRDRRVLQLKATAPVKSWALSKPLEGYLNEARDSENDNCCQHATLFTAESILSVAAYEPIGVMGKLIDKGHHVICGKYHLFLLPDDTIVAKNVFTGQEHIQTLDDKEAKVVRDHLQPLIALYNRTQRR